MFQRLPLETQKCVEFVASELRFVFIAFSRFVANAPKTVFEGGDIDFVVRACFSAFCEVCSFESDEEEASGGHVGVDAGIGARREAVLGAGRVGQRAEQSESESRGGRVVRSGDEAEVAFTVLSGFVGVAQIVHRLPQQTFFVERLTFLRSVRAVRGDGIGCESCDVAVFGNGAHDNAVRDERHGSGRFG